MDLVNVQVIRGLDGPKLNLVLVIFVGRSMSTISTSSLRNDLLMMCPFLNKKSYKNYFTQHNLLISLINTKVLFLLIGKQRVITN